MESRKACLTTYFAILKSISKQMNFNVSALDGGLIKQSGNFILRRYTCFKTTSIMSNWYFIENVENIKKCSSVNCYYYGTGIRIKLIL